MQCGYRMREPTVQCELCSASQELLSQLCCHALCKDLNKSEEKERYAPADRSRRAMQLNTRAKAS